MTDYDAALKRIETTAVTACYGCGNPRAQWTQPMLVALPDVGEGKIKDEGPEAFVFACTSCGCMRLFATELTTG